jgi:hypothetical protein
MSEAFELCAVAIAKKPIYWQIIQTGEHFDKTKYPLV